MLNTTLSDYNEFDNQRMKAQLSPTPSFDTQRLAVSHGHHIWLEQTGNPQGIPVLYLHGGPGAGLGLNYCWPFDLDIYRVIGFDQRGCGRSTPFGDTKHNTTDMILDDIQTIRQHLGIEKWILFGGSWGSTLALLSAIQHPESVSHMVLRGVFLARQQDFDWFLTAQGGAAQIYPEAYELFTRYINDTSTTQAICNEFSALFQSQDEQAFMALADWYNWEGFISRFITPECLASDLSPDHQVKSLAMLECHYLSNACFLPENYILDNSHKIAHLPCQIVHGRYDMVCKLEAAYSLQQHLPKSELNIVNSAGHSMSESHIAEALGDIMRTLSQRVGY